MAGAADRVDGSDRGRAVEEPRTLRMSISGPSPSHRSYHPMTRLASAVVEVKLVASPNDMLYRRR